MHTNYYKVFTQLSSFKIIIVVPTCFGLHKPSSGSSQPVLRESYNVDFGYISLFEVSDIEAAYALLGRVKDLILSTCTAQICRQLNSIYFIELHVPAYIRLHSSPQLAFKHILRNVSTDLNTYTCRFLIFSLESSE